ncbi:hypothetical protein L484_007496 [Morus notabilis]|uniref:Uncharacterized protein n=1 Tax=Morus notabilis TaxID=981085 RepID=W9S2I2_9ROSA|nr:hypothetical protein L484_007496 [Morus notabilis]
MKLNDAEFLKLSRPTFPVYGGLAGVRMAPILCYPIIRLSTCFSLPTPLPQDGLTKA